MKKSFLLILAFCLSGIVYSQSVERITAELEGFWQAVDEDSTRLLHFWVQNDLLRADQVRKTTEKCQFLISSCPPFVEIAQKGGALALSLTSATYHWEAKVLKLNGQKMILSANGQELIYQKVDACPEYSLKLDPTVKP